MKDKGLLQKYLWCIPLLLGVACAMPALLRDLWFDEALTVTNFMLPNTLAGIYFNYTIPNNQICYTMLLKVWNFCLPEFGDVVPFWRFLSLVCALTGVGIYWKLRRKLDGKDCIPALLLLVLLVISPVWRNYATALRGYGASLLWIAMAQYGTYLVFHESRTVRGWGLYVLASLLALGTVPTNLAALGGVVLYALPWSKRPCWRDQRVYALAVIPLLALILFYTPIARQFLHTFALNEGFPNRAGALAVTYGMLLASFGLLGFLPVALKRVRPFRAWLPALVLLIPGMAILCLHCAPFPRVFVPLVPVIGMVLTDLLKILWQTRSRKFQLAAVGIIVFSALAAQFAAPRIARQAGLSVYDDDFFRPWYMADDYAVMPTVKALKKMPDNVPYFFSFSADPATLWFYSVWYGVKKDYRMDLPNGSVGELPDNALAVLRKDESPDELKRRFPGNWQETAQTSLHRIWRRAAEK